MDYQKELEKAKTHAEKVKLRQEINEIWHSNDQKRKSLSFSKVAVIFIFINCFVIELYSMAVMVVFHDLTSLGSLVMAVLGQCVSLLGYFIKSGKENTASGIVYETTMLQLQHELDSDEVSSSIEVDEDDGAVG